MRRAEGHGGGEVVNDLRKHAAPVDRIDTCEGNAITEVKIVEHIFDARLAVVKVTRHGERVYVAFRWCGHLAALHF